MRNAIHSVGKHSQPARTPALEWLKEAASGEARATVSGSRRALIENYTGIREFTPELVRLASKNGEIRVQGQDLRLTDVREHSLIVRGSIEAVDLPSREEGSHA